jgi:hypothetical protein
MTLTNLGRLDRVELRDIWLSEASDFKTAINSL